MENCKITCKIHFVGVGGVSMSALAKYCKALGFTVSGSDRVESDRIKELKKLGIEVFIGHNAENVNGANVVVFSDAIKKDNPERIACENSTACVIDRAQLLNMVSKNFAKKIGVSGCHGKTTVTCMIAHILKCAGVKFTAHIGGDDLKYGNFIFDGSEVFLTEVCEYRKNINSFTADYAVCTNIGVDHMDCYKDEGELKNAYLSFIKRGYKSIIPQNDQFLTSLKPSSSVSFGVGDCGDYTARNLKNNKGRSSFDLYENGVKKGRIKLSVGGRYNVNNALSAIACAMEMGIPFKSVKLGLREFKGVKRRFERIGKLGGCEVFADYAHHPTEITACLENAYKICKGKVLVAFQPHTFSRTLYLKDEFVKSLKEIKELALYKTYSAREEPIDGGRAEDLCEKLPNSRFFDDVNSMLDYFKGKIKKGDTLLILGAGDLYELVKSKVNNL